MKNLNSLPLINTNPLPTTPDPLAALRPYHLPAPISWWPPAPGWWMVALLLLIVIAISFTWWLNRYRRLAVMRQAHKELTALQADWRQRGDTAYFMRELSKLLRRFAVAKFPRQQVAGLTGVAWLEFLDAHGGSGHFQMELGRLLAQLPYQNDAVTKAVLSQPQQIEQLVQLVSNWLNHNQEPNKNV